MQTLFMVQDEIIVISPDTGQMVLFGQTLRERVGDKSGHVHWRNFCECPLQGAPNSSHP